MQPFLCKWISLKLIDVVHNYTKMQRNSYNIKMITTHAEKTWVCMSNKGNNLWNKQPNLTPAMYFRNLICLATTTSKQFYQSYATIISVMWCSANDLTSLWPDSTDLNPTGTLILGYIGVTILRWWLAVFPNSWIRWAGGELLPPLWRKKLILCLIPQGSAFKIIVGVIKAWTADIEIKQIKGIQKYGVSCRCICIDLFSNPLK